MATIKIFETSEGRVYSFPQEQESRLVFDYLYKSTDTAPVNGRMAVDRFGGVRHWRDGDPGRWCKSYPVDHPERPKAEGRRS